MSTELALLSRASYRDNDLAGARLRGLLALLAGDLRTGCSTARLIEGLWPEDLPENPTKALQILVSRARAQLGSDLIVTTPTGYRLALTDEQVDTSAVLLRAAESARHSRAGDHAASLTAAEAGLALWDGPPSGDHAPDDPLSALRAERATAYSALVRARALAQSRLGRHAEAVGALTELLPERPRDEELVLELLRCEAATAGPSAALARYDAYRRSLRDELGTDPGAPLRALHQQLLQDDVPAVRHGVPYEPNLLLGRSGDIAAVRNLISASRVTSIVGAGGLGKTRLAYVVSREAEQPVVHVVELARISSDDDVVNEVASVLGVAESRRTAAGRAAGPPGPLAGIAAALDGRVLLVLDNCEHVVRGAAALVQALVSLTRDLRILTTSRAPLGLSSESVYALPGLDLPTSVELFGQRARAARPEADLPPDVVAELCGHLDGLPLAVELAAARVRVMSVAEIARRLEDRFALLRGGPRDAPERHRTLQAVVDWSWNLLEPAAQAALRALSVFPGGFTADAAEHLLGDDALQLVEDLVDQSLLEVADTGTGTRFRMLETVRQFSTAHREAAGESEQVVERFLAWVRDFGIAHHEGPFGPDPFRSCELLRAEQDNLLQALRYGVARADGPAVAAATALLGGLWIIESNYTRLATLDEAAWVLSHFRPDPELVGVTRLAATVSLVSVYMLQGVRAVRPLVTLRRLPPAPPTTAISATAVVLLATAEVPGSELATLQELAGGGEPAVAAVASGMLSYYWERAGDLDAALKAAGGMVGNLPAQGYPWMRGMAHARVGELCLQVDRPEEAERHLGVALTTFEQIRAPADGLDQYRWAMVLVSLQLGAVDEAERWLELASGEPTEDVATFTFGLGVQAEISLARGEIETGLRGWRRTVDELRERGTPILDMDPDLDPWTLEVKGVAVTAHARHDRLDLVEDLTAELPKRLTAMLGHPLTRPPAYLMDLAVCGVLLVALGLTDLADGARTGDKRLTATGVRLIALAERLRFLRNFQPTMAPGPIRELARSTDSPAYDDAVSSYAGLDRDELRATALAALRERDQLRG